MKKLLTILMAVLILLSMSACKKKEETKPEPEDQGIHFSLSVDFGNGNSESLQIGSAAGDNLLELLNGTKEGGILTYSVENGKFVEVNDTKAENGASFDVYINDGLYGGNIEELKVKDGDKIRIVYVPAVVENTTPSDNTVSSIENTPHESVLGGWEIYQTFEEDIKKEDVAIFEKAAEESLGVAYVPLRVLATQVVLGVNYAYLCQGVTLSAIPEVSYYIIVVYVPTEGDPEIKAINKLNVPELEIKEDSSENMLGSWMILQAKENSKFSDKEIQKSFEKAVKGWTGLDLTPMQLLATQLVSGTNYLALCYGKTVTEKPVGDLYVVQWYQDLQGNASISSVENLNMAYYVAGE